MKKIAFIFKEGRVLRLKQKSKFPTEFFYGYIELKRKFNNLDLLEDKDIGMSPPLSFISKIINRLFFFFPYFPFGLIIPLLKAKNLRTINKYDTLIVTTNSLGLILGLGKVLQVVKPKIVFIAMGLINYDMRKWQINFLKFITKKLYLATISKYEQNFLEKRFNKSIHYLPFGIDVDFWKPSKKNKTNEKFILSIGNDSHRDWETLIKAWSSKFPNLKIITNHKITTKKKNIKILNSNWNTKKISDQEILKFYNLCDFVIIPLKNTIQPSGQSVCLQAMACNKIVVISKIDGIWDKNNLIENEHIVYVKPMNENLLREKIKEILFNKEKFSNIDKVTRSNVIRYFTVKNFSIRFESYLKNLGSL